MGKIIVVDALASTHTHLRGLKLIRHLIALAKQGGADVLFPMPNVGDGLQTAQETDEYRRYAETVELPGDTVSWRPAIRPIAMLTEKTTIKMIDEWVAMGIFDTKIYPKDRTTKSESGVVRYLRLLPQVAHCGKVGVRVHVHPEHPDMLFGNREAEYQFIAIVLAYLQETEAQIVWEHGTDARCIPFWEAWAQSGRFLVTLTAHHLATNEDLTFGDVRAVCKPPIKTEQDRRALIDLVCKDYPWVVAGLDDAWHPDGAKQVPMGKCACGACTYGFGLQLYAHVLEERLLTTKAGVDVFQNFTSRNARRVYGLPSARQVRLEREAWEIPLTWRAGDEVSMPFWAGQKLNWRLDE